jgi:hypothetical protein
MAHGAELDHAERPSVETDALLDEEGIAAELDGKEHGGHGHQRHPERGSHERYVDVEDSLQHGF